MSAKFTASARAQKNALFDWMRDMGSLKKKAAYFRAKKKHSKNK